MDSEVIYDSPYATLWYHPESKIIHHKIYKFSKAEEFLTFINLASNTLAEKGAKKWLSDDQSVLLVEKEGDTLNTEKWSKKTIEAGWKYWAIVKPKHVISQINMEKMVKYYNSLGITAKFFTDVDEALHWLENF